MVSEYLFLTLKDTMVNTIYFRYDDSKPVTLGGLKLMQVQNLRQGHMQKVLTFKGEPDKHRTLHLK